MAPLELVLVNCAAFGYGALLGYYIGGREGARNMRRAFRLVRQVRHEQKNDSRVYSRSGIRDSDIVRSMADVSYSNNRTSKQG